MAYFDTVLCVLPLRRCHPGRPSTAERDPDGPNGRCEPGTSVGRELTGIRVRSPRGEHAAVRHLPTVVPHFTGGLPAGPLVEPAGPAEIPQRPEDRLGVPGVGH